MCGSTLRSFGPGLKLDLLSSNGGMWSGLGLYFVLVFDRDIVFGELFWAEWRGVSFIGIFDAFEDAGFGELASFYEFFDAFRTGFGFAGDALGVSGLTG